MALDAELQEILRRHCSSLGTSFVSKGSCQVLAQPSNRLLFAKKGAIDQVLGEAESLNAMYRASLAAGQTQTLIPTIHAFGKIENKGEAFLVTDYKQLSSGLSRKNQRTLGEKLAQMHRSGTSENGMYGFSRPTHCGATEQDNTWTSNWSDFWADRRIGDLIRKSGDEELARLETQLREKVYPLLFNQEAMKDVRPAIIHGDLWSGNAGTDGESGEPIIFDPSSSFSHNEAELGIMKMFGGYGNDFFSAYHQVIPKAQPHYNERQEMYEAYHHLNHFVMFGGSYRAGAVRIFKRLIAWAEEKRREGGNDTHGGGGGSGGKQSNAGPNVESGNMARGLRGGNRHDSTSLTSHDSSSTSFHLPPLPSPPPPSTSAARSISTSLGNGVKKSSLSSGGSFPPTTPSQIADYFSQMICYLWFSTGVPGHSIPTTPSRSPTSVHQPLQSSPLAPRRTNPHPTPSSRSHRNYRAPHTKATSAGSLSQALSTSLNSHDLSKAIQDHLVSVSTATVAPIATNSKLLANDPILRRLQPKSRFLRFSREILSTTQVSSSVITLALIYVHRLKAAHPHMKGREGSEYRLAISSLMLANKILDDNTYLNKTWAEISGMPLIEISKMEVEFWLGLKMELHITKEDYETGLKDLQMLASDRNEAVLQRDAAMKRAMQQQQQQQEQQQQQQAFMASSQQLPHPWSCYLPSHHSASLDGSSFSSPLPPLDSQLPNVRRSISNMDATSNHRLLGYSFPGQTAPPCHASMNFAYDFGGVNAGNQQSHAPPAPHVTRSTTFTLPPSPLSQSSTGFSARVQGDGFVSPHSFLDGGLNHSSPPINRDRISSSSASQSISGDSMWSMLHQEDPTSMRNPSSSSINPFSARSSQTTETSPMSSTNSLGFTPDYFVSQGVRRQLSSNQNTSTLSGLKRDFELTNLHQFSPYEHQDDGNRCSSSGNKNKRFAAEPKMYAGLKQYQDSSAASRRTSDTPVESRYALRSQSRAPMTMNDFQGRKSTTPNEAIRNTSASPNRFSTAFARSASPAAHHDRQRGCAHLPKSVAANEVHSSQQTERQESHPSYHSVFTSALTPNTLAAPLENSSMNATSNPYWYGGASNGPRQIGPLQYYSLAAGEPFGNIGTYMPPLPSANTDRSPWNADPTGPRRSSLSAESRSAHNAASKSEYANHHWVDNHDAGTQLPSSAASLKSRHVGTMATNESGNQNPNTSVSFTHSRAPVAPFTLDIDAWPLQNSSTSTFLFPYHLLPLQPQGKEHQHQHPPPPHTYQYHHHNLQQPDSHATQ
ncbi:hypothetical protein CBS101457_003662 [Exobasidium rhododendri]|nr:hypothetical protein CBS101457_003662 [Exobasidium rhododendri]